MDHQIFFWTVVLYREKRVFLFFGQFWSTFLFTFLNFLASNYTFFWFFRVKRRFCRHITLSKGIAVRTHGWHRSGTVKLSKLVTSTAWLAGLLVVNKNQNSTNQLNKHHTNTALLVVNVNQNSTNKLNKHHTNTTLTAMPRTILKNLPIFHMHFSHNWQLFF